MKRRADETNLQREIMIMIKIKIMKRDSGRAEMLERIGNESVSQRMHNGEMAELPDSPRAAGLDFNAQLVENEKLLRMKRPQHDWFFHGDRPMRGRFHSQSGFGLYHSTCFYLFAYIHNLGCGCALSELPE
jgi:hypothetical protein